jgi:hypothetical protein
MRYSKRPYVENETQDGKVPLSKSHFCVASNEIFASNSTKQPKRHTKKMTTSPSAAIVMTTTKDDGMAELNEDVHPKS